MQQSSSIYNITRIGAYWDLNKTVYELRKKQQFWYLESKNRTNYKLLNSFSRFQLSTLLRSQAMTIEILIMIKRFLKSLSNTLCIVILFIPLASNATVVEVRTVMGDFQINLFDEATPLTVANFLSYVNAGAYANNVVHRSEPGFVIQGGGFVNTGTLPLDSVATGDPVTNEPVLSNVRGTISMAKQVLAPNSATSQWFINLADNSSFLDTQNSGFTAFGQVLGDGMSVVESIAALTRFNFGGVVDSIPLRDYTAEDFTNNVDITEDNFVIITDIVVIDAETVTNPQLTPTPNTRINAAPGTDNGGDSFSSSGGGFGYGALFALLVLFLRLKTNKSTFR